ncbi:MAG: double zinc ribbon domain-containing protein [Clostridia bacterium]|nr:double zinc ribbon domain-containing protein [Clostridia bacterium]
MNNLIDKFFSHIFPHKCTFCRTAIPYTNDSFICSSCKASLPYTSLNGCAKCGKPLGDFALPVCLDCRREKRQFSGSFTPLKYEGNVRRALINMKFYDAPYFTRSFAVLIAERILSGEMPHIDFITYVPLSQSRLSERGFNQSQLTAQFLGEILNLPVKPTLICREGTARQSTLNYALRRENAKKSFYGENISLSGMALLVDDIMTTGSTLSACASILIKLGCSKVYIAACASKQSSRLTDLAQ